MAEPNIEQTTDSNRDKDGPELLALDPALLTTAETAPVEVTPINITQENHEGVVFIWYDYQDRSGLHLLGPLRAINDKVKAFTDSPSCLYAIKTSKDKIFFITSSSSTELITTVHNFDVVEAIFIINPNIETIKGDFPKLFGIFNQQEELFLTLKEVFDTFELIQFELFTFEEDKVFLWSQLWRQELTRKKKASKKHVFIGAARQYYEDNPIITRFIDELDRSYRPAEVINWCLHSPFPSRFLHHAVRSHNKEQLSVCRPIFADASRFFIQHPLRKTSDQFYRGMKLSNELLEQFAAHIGRLVCTNGFFPSTKSRTNALTLASLPTYRPDLLPVFFKIDCDASTNCIEVPGKNSTTMMAFDICTVFRVVYVNRGPMTVIKMKTTGETGKKIALDYIEAHKDRTLQSLLDELVRPPTPPKPPTPPPPPPPKKPKVKPAPPSEPVITAEEIKAQRYAERGEIDRALATYQRIKPINARLLISIGQLSADKKRDYNYAVLCLTQALKLQEEAGEDPSDTLSSLGNAYHNATEYDLALSSHKRALTLRQAKQDPDHASIAANFIGVGNAHWARHEYPEAIEHTQQALAVRESLVPLNESSVAATLGMLGSIYQDSGNNGPALELCTKALTLFEGILSADSPIIAELLCNVGTIQAKMDSLDEACRSFERAAKIYKKLLPKEHPDRIAVEEEHRRLVQLNQTNKNNSEEQS